MSTVVKSIVNQNGDASMLAYVDFDGIAAVQATVSSITCKVIDTNGVNPTSPILSPTITVASVIFDSLQLDARWDVDKKGYNFLHDLPPAAFPIGKHNYHVIYQFTSSTGKIAFAKYEVKARVTDY